MGQPGSAGYEAVVRTTPIPQDALSCSDRDEVARAARLLAAERELTAEHVRDRIRAAASRAGIPAVRLARLVIEDRAAASGRLNARPVHEPPRDAPRRQPVQQPGRESAGPQPRGSSRARRQA
ncbi:hypothetical protein UB45_19380 [Terrabacter sp. 28]|nr:hypothetical protein UB45_19380 [Terrabacter sp. 28]